MDVHGSRQQVERWLGVAERNQNLGQIGTEDGDRVGGRPIELFIELQAAFVELDGFEVLSNAAELGA